MNTARLFRGKCRSGQLVKSTAEITFWTAPKNISTASSIKKEQQFRFLNYIA
jgi:hypothetical protein